MNRDIVKTLVLMCDKNNPQDKKLLLLAELVETKCSSLAESQAELKQSLNETNTKLDKLTNLLEKYENDKNSCPVFKNKEDFEKITMFVKYPKISFLVILGVFVILMGLISTGAIDLLKFLFSL